MTKQRKKEGERERGKERRGEGARWMKLSEARDVARTRLDGKRARGTRGGERKAGVF